MMKQMNLVSLLGIFSALISGVSAQENATSTSTSRLFEIDWDSEVDRVDSARVGDMIQFTLNITEAIYIITNPDTTCNLTTVATDDMEQPVNYTFTSDDANTEITFGSNVTGFCDPEQSLRFVVSPSEAERPASCESLEDALRECQRNLGVGTLGRGTCRTCINSAVTAGLRRAGGSCIAESPGSTCRGFTRCACSGCYLEAAAYGSCRIGLEEGDSCGIVDCGAEVARVSASTSKMTLASFVAALAVAAILAM